jgi:DNA-binding response OmpR family regulator
MNKQIMVIDDEPTTRNFLGMVLDRSGFAVLKAEDDLATLDILNEATPDLIVLDLTLPGIDGIELCKQIRARAETAQTPIIVLSGRADAGSVRQATEAGANDYLIKPALEEELVSKIHNFLGENSKVQ